jgi:hypothetical protein
MYIKRFKSGIVGCKIMDEQQISGYIMAAGGFVMDGKFQKSSHLFLPLLRKKRKFKW